MKTIEERAKEYADMHKATEFNYFGVGQVYGYERIYNAEITAYERGAKEQRKIDIEKACKYLMEHISGDVECNEDGEPFAESFIEERKFVMQIVDDFRKAMEE